MPTLTWIGKDKVVTHHNDVPFRVLEQQYTFGETDTHTTDTPGQTPQNRIIHGDNLEALKALLPYYEGRIKCIYIDPPYNTGNENWVYNDNVNDPKIKRWLGKVVGKESEDLSRHDKWLCMMYPRLVLLHRLLADDGAIFVSIDDNEQASLKLIMDEVFGRGNFVVDIIWRSSDSSNNDVKQFSTDHNHTHVYAKKGNWLANRLERLDTNNQHYKNPDNDPNGSWFMGNLSSPNPRPNLRYILTSPSGITINPPANGWRWSWERMQEMISTKEVIFSNDETRIVKKTYLKDQKGIAPSSNWWDIEETGHNRNAKYELKKIFAELQTTDVFSTPKPTKFLEKIIKIATDKDSIILDSFAGSGTTAHAVLNLNKQDGGSRQFILVEMEDYAETITAERVRRVIDGYGTKEGTGGNFAYYELGPALFTEENLLNENLPLARIREYVWYSETRSPLPPRNAEPPSVSPPETGEKMAETTHFLGKLFDTAYYFYYEPNQLTTLDYDLLSTVQTPAEQYVIYADNCLLAREWLQQRRIIFKKIPRDISRF